MIRTGSTLSDLFLQSVINSMISSHCVHSRVPLFSGVLRSYCFNGLHVDKDMRILKTGLNDIFSSWHYTVIISRCLIFM